MTTARLEFLDTRAAVAVDAAEYRRLLGYPRGHVPGERARELELWARGWYGEHGRPWVYLREAELEFTADALRLDGAAFDSPKLREHLRKGGATRAMFVAVSAGPGGEAHARALWEDAKPDEYFFLEVFGSAVVEHLVASLNGRICALAESEGLSAIPHYSPGYAGWDVVDQNKLHERMVRGATVAFPEPLEVLASGMLKPKKSLLAVVGLAPRTEGAGPRRPAVPCTSCSYSPCQYRRAAYRHQETAVDGAPQSGGLSRDGAYSVSTRALQKWARERVTIERRDDGTTEARFRFDGTTCSNMGRPLAFDYAVSLDTAARHYAILQADCRPAADDDGYQSMCAYLSDGPRLTSRIAAEKPLLGRPLDDVLGWVRPNASSGCHCTAESRAHKWGLALEAIHYALAQSEAGATTSQLPRP